MKALGADIVNFYKSENWPEGLAFDYGDCKLPLTADQKSSQPALHATRISHRPTRCRCSPT